MTEALALERAQRSFQLLRLLAHHVDAELTVRPVAIALVTKRRGQVEDDGHRQHVVLAGEPHDGLARFALNVGRVDHGQAARLEPLAGDVMQHIECIGGGALVVLVVGDEPATVVRGEDLRGLEVLLCKRALAASRRADERNQSELRDLDSHR